MARIEIKDHKAGMNRTRSKRRGPAGSLWLLKNAVITRGGDISRSKKFAPYADLSGFGTKGLAAIGDLPVVFSHVPVSAPGSTQVQVLAHPDGLAIDRILCVEAFDDKLYVIAQFADGSIHHYYDRERVTTWLSAPASYADINDVAALLAQLIDDDLRYSATSLGPVVTVTGLAGEAFSFFGFVEDNSGAADQSIAFNVTQGAANPAGETLATASLRVASGTIGDPGAKPMATFLFTRPDSGAAGTLTSLIAGATEFVTAPITVNAGDPASDAAIALEAQINGGAHGFTATRNGAAVMITGPSHTDALNGVDLIPTFTGTGLNSDAARFLNGANPQNRVTDIRVNGVSQIGAPVLYGATPEATAQSLKSAMDAYGASPDYAVTVSGQRLIFTAGAGTGAAPNNYQIEVDVEGDVVFDQQTAFSGGVDAGPSASQIVEITVAGTFNGKDAYVVSLGNRRFQADVYASGIGVWAWTYKGKMHLLANSQLFYSKLGDPTDFADTANGAGFINVSNQRKGDRRLTAIAEYQSFASIFSADDAKIFLLNEDDDLNSYNSSVDNVGAIAPGPVLPFGNRDVFFLSASGIRSLRPRDSSGAAFSEDVGTLIDPFVTDILGTLTDEEVRNTKAVIEPLDGRYWLALKNTIMVFSYFPSAASKISAWSFIEPGFTVDGMVRAGANRIFVRSGDQVYLYGGLSGAEYPEAGETPAVAELPFLDGDNPSAMKVFNSLDADVDNLWRIEAAYDENQPDLFDHVADAERTTFISDIVPLNGRGPSIALRFSCDAGGPATLSHITLNYQEASAY